VSFDHAFTFLYSPRRGTDAARMDGQVGEDTKRERLVRLVEVVQRHARLRNQELLGTLQEVLVEGSSRTDPDVLRGRTRTNKTVLLTDAVPGELVQVRIEAATSQTLRGVRERIPAAV
jgi:tRNA-2-methylthio-N6-dimethylallyladenosine synthase